MKPLYYLPGASSAPRETLRELGLDDLLPDPVTTQVVTGGPDGKRGAIVAATDDPRHVAYDADNQTWAKLPDKDVWLGLSTKKPPTPDDLARAEQHYQYEPTLGDGRAWRVPTAILADGVESPLPKVPKIDDETGSIVRRVHPRFDDLRLKADRVREAFKHGHKIPFADEVQICVAALNINYRIGLDEALALNILTDEARALIFWVLVDRAGWPDADKLLAEK